MNLSNVKTLYKIMLCFAVVTVFIAGTTWFATSRMRQIDDTYTMLLEQESIAMKEGVRVQSSLQNFARLMWRLVSETDAAELKGNEEEVTRNRERMAEFTQKIGKLVPSYRQRFVDVHRGYEKLYQEDYQAIKAAKAAGKHEDALRIARALAPKSTALRTQAQKVTDELEKHVMDGSAAAAVETNNTIMVTMTVTSIALGAAMLMAFLLAQFSIVRPLTALTRAMRELANGNFDVVLPGLGRKDEVGEIAGAVEGFKIKAAEKAKLEADETLRRQKAEAEAEAAAQARLAAEQARVAEEQAKKAKEQAQALETLAGGLDRLSKGDLSFQLTSGFTDEYKQIRDDFNGAIAQLKETIGALSASTNEVAAAATEIATATTDLSQRTEEQAASLEETSASMEQISATVKKNARTPSRPTAPLPAPLNEIVKSIESVAYIVSDIASASAEQAGGIDQVNKALAQMDEVTQQNSALVEENAVTAKNLQQQSAAMTQSVGVFKLHDSGRTEQFSTAAKLPANRMSAPSRGPARHMQAGLATALKAEPEFQEF